VTMSTRRPPVPAIDPDGRAVLYIPLANTSDHAKVLPEDHCRLTSEGVSPNWYMNCGSVRVADHRRNPQRIARLILGATGDVRVGYRDRNPYNLRRDNLVARPFNRGKRQPQRPTARPFAAPPQ
jgi:hypothetical protein